MKRNSGFRTAVQSQGSGGCRWAWLPAMLGLLIAVGLPWREALAQTPAPGLYDVFGGASIDSTRWTDLELAREIRAGKLVSLLRAAGTPGLLSNNLRFTNPGSIQSFQADVRLNANTFPPGGSSRARLMGSYYSASSAPRPPGVATGDVRAELYIQGRGGTVEVLYEVYKCTTADCVTTVPVVPPRQVQPAALGQVHTLAIGWDGAQFTFTVDGVAQPAVNPGDCVAYRATCQPVVSSAPNVPVKLAGTQLRFAIAGGTGSVAADFDNASRNGSLYDDFSAPRLVSGRWTDREVVREVRQGALVSKAFATGAANTNANTRSRILNSDLVKAIRADVTVSDYRAANSAVGARLVGTFFNDGRSTGPSDACGDVTSSIEIGADNQDGGLLRARYSIDHFASDCTTTLTTIQNFLLPITLNQPSTLLLSFDGNRFHFSVSNTAGTESYDVPVTSFGTVAKRPVQRFRELRTRVRVNNLTATPDYIAASFDNVRLNSEALPPAVLALTADKTAPWPAGTPINFTASASGGTGSYQSRWFLWDGVKSVLLRDWAPGLSYTWTPASGNPANRITVHVRSAGGAWVGASGRSLPFPIMAPLGITNLSADKSAPQPAGTPIRVNVTANGGTGTYQSQWSLWDGVTSTLLRDWAAGLSYTWTPASGNAAYLLTVNVRDGGGTLVATSQRSLPFPITDHVTGIHVSYRLDPWLISGNYTGGLWASPPTLGPVAQGNTFTLETRAEGLDAFGMASKISALWIPEDPWIVTTSPSQGHQVAITVHRAGQSSLRVVSQGVVKTLAVKAMPYLGTNLLVEISK